MVSLLLLATAVQFSANNLPVPAADAVWALRRGPPKSHLCRELAHLDPYTQAMPADKDELLNLMTIHFGLRRRMMV